MQNKLWPLVGLILIAGIGVFVYSQKQRSLTTVPVTPTENATSTSETATTTPTSFTLAQVATHSTRESCWTAINGNVYDLTSWIPNHPGGESAILSICGIDGSTRFNNQHGHDSRAQGVLAGFKIGTLTQ